MKALGTQSNRKWETDEQHSEKEGAPDPAVTTEDGLGSGLTSTTSPHDLPGERVSLAEAR